MELTQKIFLILFAAAVGEGVNEFFFLPWLDPFKEKMNEVVRIQILRLWSGLVGVLIAWQLSLNIFELLGATLVWPVMGYILTGLLLGRGSNYLHDLLKRYVQTER